MLLSPVQPLVAAYVMGLLAAMPIGPVNMIAIRRGVMWRWTHTLACGSGAAIGDLTLFCLALLGGRWLLPYLESGTVRIVLAATGIAVLVPVGVLFLVRGFSLSLPAIARARRRLQDKPPQHFIVDVATGTALTLFNPLCAGYWGAATAGWLPSAKIYLGWAYFGWGLSMAGAGLMSWFLLLTVLVRFTPNRLGPVFFRYVNFVCGLILLGFGVFCGSLIVQTLRNHS
jgi:threonine/homoserine/homoserine lactone efflux protein